MSTFPTDPFVLFSWVNLKLRDFYLAISKNIADKIIVLADGKVAEYGDREKVFPKLMDVRSGCYFTKNS